MLLTIGFQLYTARPGRPSPVSQVPRILPRTPEYPSAEVELVYTRDETGQPHKVALTYRDSRSNSQPPEFNNS
jgi:hypothetical protein